MAAASRFISDCPGRPVTVDQPLKRQFATACNEQLHQAAFGRLFHVRRKLWQRSQSNTSHSPPSCYSVNYASSVALSNCRSELQPRRSGPSACRSLALSDSCRMRSLEGLSLRCSGGKRILERASSLLAEKAISALRR